MPIIRVTRGSSHRDFSVECLEEYSFIEMEMQMMRYVRRVFYPLDPYLEYEGAWVWSIWLDERRVGQVKWVMAWDI